MSDVGYTLVWLAGARPPVHPEPMKGRQSFDSVDDALTFFKKLANDAKAISLTRVEVTTSSVDLSNLLPAARLDPKGGVQ